MSALSRARRAMSQPRLRPVERVFERHSKAFLTSIMLVRCYYAALLFLTVSSMQGWVSTAAKSNPQLLWPVAWVRFVPFQTAAICIIALYAGSAILAGFLPGRRFARLLAFIGLIEYAALVNSFGKIAHNLHVLVLTAFVLIFLPDVDPRESRPPRLVRHRYLTVVWACQAIFMLTYSMAGLGKLIGGIHQTVIGEYSIFYPKALAIHIAHALLSSGGRSIFGPWLIDHAFVGYPMMSIMLYLQLFSVWAALRPAVHKLWALGLLAFQMGTFLLMNILSVEHVLMLGLLLICSPFADPTTTLAEALASLPIVGPLFRRLLFRRNDALTGAARP